MTRAHDCYYGCGFGVKRAVASCSRANCDLKEIARLLAFREAQRDDERYKTTNGRT